jgi:hypothetical protein
MQLPTKKQKLLEKEFLDKIDVIRDDAERFEETKDIAIFKRMRIDVGFIIFLAQAALCDEEITERGYEQIMEEMLEISETVKETLGGKDHE